MLGAGELLVELGAGFLVLIDGMYSDLLTGELVEPTELDSDAWKRLIDTTHRVADIAIDQFGLQLVFSSPCRVSRRVYRADRDIPAADRPGTGGHLSGCGPSCLPGRRCDRVYAPAPRAHPLSAPSRASIARCNSRSRPRASTFAEAVKMDMFVEPALGWVDYLAFRDVLRDVGFDGWAMVEQDMYPAPFDKPLPIAQADTRLPARHRNRIRTEDRRCRAAGGNRTKC